MPKNHIFKKIHDYLSMILQLSQRSKVVARGVAKPVRP